MDVLVIGGSGILSTDFVKKLLDKKHNVTLVNRGLRQRFIDERANLIVANIRKESIQQLAKKINVGQYDVVVDFLSYVPEHIQKCLAILSENFKQYVFISSATAYCKENEDTVITENTPVGNEKWKYAYDKYRCERYLKEHTDINYTIIRPYVTYSDSRIPFPIIPDGFYYTLLERIKEGKPIALYNNGDAVCTLTHTKDFAEILYKLLLNEKAYKDEFHITSSYVQTWREVYLMLCEIIGAKPNSFSVDLAQIKKYMPEYYESLSGDKGTNMVFDNTKVINAIGGYQFKISLRQGLENCIRFFQDNSELQRINYKWDGRVDYMYKHCVDSGQKVKCIKLKNKFSSNRLMYYAMTNSLFRTGYETLKILVNGKCAP